MKALVLLVFFISLMNFSCSSSDSKGTKSIDGTWTPVYITGLSGKMDDSFPDKKPFIKFNKVKGDVSGNGGCNNFSGKFSVSGKSISLNENLAITDMFCQSGMEGEKAFVSALLKAESYRFSSNGQLELMEGKNTIVRLKKMDE